jgi:hypothetical protein
MKRAFLLFVAVSVVGAGSSAVQAGGDKPRMRVTIHLVSQRYLAGSDLYHAAAYATEIYRASGIETVWTEAPWKRASASSPSFRVVLLSDDMADRKCREAGLDDSTLGMAVALAESDRSRIAFVFVDRIRRLARRGPDSTFELGLGLVMAHEVGHLLLGVKSHAQEGLMAPGWNPWERRVLTFTSEQAERIFRRAAATSSVDE